MINGEGNVKGFSGSMLGTVVYGIIGSGVLVSPIVVLRIKNSCISTAFSIRYLRVFVVLAR